MKTVATVCGYCGVGCGMELRRPPPHAAGPEIGHPPTSMTPRPPGGPRPGAPAPPPRAPTGSPSRHDTAQRTRSTPGCRPTPTAEQLRSRCHSARAGRCCRRRPWRGRHRHRGMAGRRDVPRHVGPHVIAAGQQRRDQHNGFVVQGPQHLVRGGTEHVDKRHSHGFVQSAGDRRSEIANHLDAVWVSGSVRYQQRGHLRCPHRGRRACTPRRGGTPASPRWRSTPWRRARSATG
jgi:hypothetical protein